MDVDRGIRVAVDTGDVTLGSEKSIQSLKLGKGQLVVVASNAPKEILEDVEYYANLSHYHFTMELKFSYLYIPLNHLKKLVKRR